MNTKTPLLVLAPLILMSSGCVVENMRTGPTRRESVHIGRDASEFLTVNLNMAAGNLKINPGTTEFLDGTAIYNVDSWKPVISYSTAAGHGNLEIRQPGVRRSLAGHTRYEWDLRLANDIPIDLTAHFGAGEADLNLGGLMLRSVDVEMGVGQLRMDLRGSPKRDYEVRVRGGVGEAVIRLPRDVGVFAKAEGGIGSINTTGLHREGDRYVNDAYDHSKVTIHLDIQGGIGSISLISE
jgi:hypothetical protein